MMIGVGYLAGRALGWGHILCVPERMAVRRALQRLRVEPSAVERAIAHARRTLA
ncbi:hypothetical protein WMF18_24440 [Sorangium sp. So ce315]|uniref:hypothetical protein n=1 Tax=Sorangium sp. So ce315 TaxID=3133299 RepID=UPI003F5FF99B